MSAGKWLGQGKRNEPHFGVLSGGIGDFEIGQKPISNPKSEISNWTASWRGRESNLRFRISDLRWAFVQFQNLRFRLRGLQNAAHSVFLGPAIFQPTSGDLKFLSMPFLPMQRAIS